MMIDGSCNLEDVEINIQGEVAAFMKEYCGVACECYKTGQGKLSMIFDAEEEFVRAEQVRNNPKKYYAMQYILTLSIIISFPLTDFH